MPRGKTGQPAQYAPPHTITILEDIPTPRELAADTPLCEFSDGDGARTSVWMALAKGDLYVHFLCSEIRPGEIIDHSTAIDRDISQQVFVDVFIDANRDMRTYFQVRVTPKGHYTDVSRSVAGLDDDLARSSQMKILKTSVTNKGWSITF